MPGEPEMSLSLRCKLQVIPDRDDLKSFFQLFCPILDLF